VDCSEIGGAVAVKDVDAEIVVVVVVVVVEVGEDEGRTKITSSFSKSRTGLTLRSFDDF
jgi:hypothetical protein